MVGLIGLKYETEEHVELPNIATSDALDHRVADLVRFKALVFGDDE